MTTESNDRVESNANLAAQAVNAPNAANAANAPNASNAAVNAANAENVAAAANNAPVANMAAVENVAMGKENKGYKTANNTNPLNQVHVYEPFIGPCDPCPPMKLKTYVLPPNLFIPYQPQGLPQYPIHEALRRGTLWPALYSSYQSKFYL